MSNLEMFWIGFSVLTVIGFIVNVYEQIKLFKQITVGELFMCLVAWIVGVISLFGSTIDLVFGKIPKIVIYKKDSK